ncbi:hypothetical protein FACS1894102_1470 [Spirochaetia bacterium]|nr:hypothetical protein FACS1894102_1470 [Spirochaetia bacterium]
MLFNIFLTLSVCAWSQDKKLPLKEIPENENVKLICEGILKNFKPSMIVEKQAIIEKPKDFKSDKWTLGEKVKVLNLITSLSTLTGVQYYSESHKKTRTFYEDSFVIKDLNSKTKIPDPVFDLTNGILKETNNNISVNDNKFVIYAKQKDNTFGENIYKYDYTVKLDAIVFVQQNITSISYGIIPLIKKENLNTVVALIDNKEHITIYIAILALTSIPQSLERRVNASFTNRADAIISWFTDKTLN